MGRTGIVDSATRFFDFASEAHNVVVEKNGVLIEVGKVVEQGQVVELDFNRVKNALVILVVDAEMRIGFERFSFVFGQVDIVRHVRTKNSKLLLNYNQQRLSMTDSGKEPIADDLDYEDRFGGLGRLYGGEVLKRLRSANVCVAGVGGVGSWAVEALARSGVGKLTMIDLDDICVTNVNRQLHALDGKIGKSKVAVMAERVATIHPTCEVKCEEVFFTSANADVLLAPDFDFVIDAIDALEHKCLLLAKCRERGITVVTCGGAGGKSDPTAVKVADLRDATNDRLLRAVRRELKREFGFSRDELESFGIAAVYSTENAVFPWSDGTVYETSEPGTESRLNCDAGLGTASFVTGTFGFAAAGEVVRRLVNAS